MIYHISVSAIAADIKELRVLEWHGAIGHRFHPGDLIVELETHKAIVEIRAAQTGVLRDILAEVGQWRKIGLPLALFGDDETEKLPAEIELGTPLSVEFAIT